MRAIIHKIFTKGLTKKGKILYNKLIKFRKRRRKDYEKRIKKAYYVKNNTK